MAPSGHSHLQHNGRCLNETEDLESKKEERRKKEYEDNNKTNFPSKHPDSH